MRILRAADYRVMPWKNGMGSTTEIAVSPEREGLDDFSWRVSMAQVASDGPFSSFPGIDRTLLLLAGQGMVLLVEGRPPDIVLHESAPYIFPGDAVTSATLIDGPIVDLNIMARRDLVRTRVQRIKLMTPRAFSLTGIHLLLVEAGELTVQSEHRIETLAVYDGLLFDAREASPTIAPSDATALISIEIISNEHRMHRF